MKFGIFLYEIRPECKTPNALLSKWNSNEKKLGNLWTYSKIGHKPQMKATKVVLLGSLPELRKTK